MVLLEDQIGSQMVICPGISGATAIIFSVLALIMIWIRAARKKIFSQLESGGILSGSLQKDYAKAQNGMRFISIVGQSLLIFGTDWTRIVQGYVGTDMAGLDELIILIPFLGWICTGFFFLYPVDRAIRESMIGDLIFVSEPVSSIWTRRQYLSFQFRFQILLVGLPLMLIISAKDLIETHRNFLTSEGEAILGGRMHELARLTPDLILGLSAGIIFIFAPVMIRVIWSAETLPRGPLRDGLYRLAEHTGMKFRDILLWPTYGVIVNAAVIGLFSRVRYILLSDGLIESLSDGQIKSVFGHELGHIKLHHMLYYLVFAVASMGLIGFSGYYLDSALDLSQNLTEIILGLTIMLIWFVVFGYISRAFEREADIFAVKVISGEFDRVGCTSPDCMREHPETDNRKRNQFLCLSAAELFESALQRTAALNAISRHTKNWRHGSIASRCDFVTEAAKNAKILRRFELKTWLIKCILILSLILCIAWGIMTAG